MKALSVRNPWALAIMLGKDIENRDWPTRLRGRIAIHASASMTRYEFDDALDFMRAIGFTFPLSFEQTKEANGKVLGTVDLVDCVRHSESPWFQGPYGFVLRDPQPFSPQIRVRGALGFWDFDAPMVVSA